MGDTIVIIVVICTSILLLVGLVSFLASKSRLMTNDMKQLTKMMEDSKDELSDLMKTGIELKKQFMEENEADLKEISKE